MNFLKTLTLSAVASLALASSASATQIAFAGTYVLSDGPDAGTWRDQFQFTSGLILTTDPAVDPMNFQAVQIATLKLDESTVTTTSADFSPSTYVAGFRVPNFIKADLTTVTLDILGGTGSVNPFLNINLTNVSADGTYVPGTSPIADAFIQAGVGASTLTIQISLAQGADLYKAITDQAKRSNGTKITGPMRNSYSGTASPVFVPDGGATLALLGAGLLMVGGISRKLR